MRLGGKLSIPRQNLYLPFNQELTGRVILGCRIRPQNRQPTREARFHALVPESHINWIAIFFEMFAEHLERGDATDHYPYLW